MKSWRVGEYVPQKGPGKDCIEAVRKRLDAANGCARVITRLNFTVR